MNPLFINSGELKAEIKGPSLWEQAIKQKVADSAIRYKFAWSVNVRYEYINIYTSRVINEDGAPYPVPKKYVFLDFTFIPKHNIANTLVDSFVDELNKIVQIYQSALQDAISVHGFLHFVAKRVRNSEFRTVSRAKKEGRESTGTEAWRDILNGKTVIADPIVNDVVEWANEYYSSMNEGYALGALGALQYGYISASSANIVAYMWQDYIIHGGKINKNALEISKTPIILDLRQGEHLTEFVDLHGNIIRFLSLGKSLSPNESLLVRGKITETSEGGRRGTLEGKVIGKRIDN